MPELFNNVNWLDLIFIILLLGMIYKGSKTGVGGQFLSLVGWIVLLFFSIGYYNVFSEAIFGFMLQKWSRPASFFAIVIGIFMSVKLLERIFNVISGEELSGIERIGGAVIAVVRAVMLFGVIGILLLLVPVDYLNTTVVKDSRSCMIFVNCDAQIYSWLTGVLGNEKIVARKDVVKNFLVTTKEKS